MSALNEIENHPATVSLPGPASRDLTDSIDGFLKRERGPLTQAVMDSVIGLDKYARQWGGTTPDPAGPFSQEFAALPDYMAFFFATGDVGYQNLYVGELLKIVHSPDLCPDDQQRKREEVVESVARRFGALAEPRLTPGARLRFLSELESMHRVAASKTNKTINVLLVGDCLTLDLVAFLAGPCRQDGIDLNPTYLNSHNPIELRKSLRGLPANGYSLVFYSPFTYTFSSDFSRTLTIGNPIISAGAVRKMIAPSLDEVRETLGLIARHFDCPVLIHNASNVRRHNSTILDRVKQALSGPARRTARREANWVIDQSVKNLGATAQVSVIDEGSLVDRQSEWELGRRFYDSDVQHPSVLSRHLAEIYHDYLVVLARLMTKKVVVSDLDNTLWEGEIGEGAVTHFLDRQATLKRLRDKGVLLAINSKNDPKNVHWQGAGLSDRDFVAAEINWEPKAENMRRIRDTLNLKTKDFVFVDDRPDQLELVSSAIPDLVALDATDAQTWRRLELWSRWLPEQDGLDRTQLYHEREQREGFIATETQDVDPVVLLERLGLKAVIREAKSADLKRVVDLINRTNQFNLNATRTTLAEVRDSLAIEGRSIFLVDGLDKFGQMGTVCVALTEREGRDVRITGFVLSCRVFGYGFETVMLNAIRRKAARGEGGSGRIIGLYRETPLNQPCRSMYPDHCFEWRDSAWFLDQLEIAADPAWLEVVDKTV